MKKVFAVLYIVSFLARFLQTPTTFYRVANKIRR